MYVFCKTCKSAILLPEDPRLCAVPDCEEKCDFDATFSLTRLLSIGGVIIQVWDTRYEKS